MGFGISATSNGALTFHKSVNVLYSVPNRLSYPIVIALFSNYLDVFYSFLFLILAPIVHYILAIGHNLSIALKDSLSYFTAIFNFAGSFYR